MIRLYDYVLSANCYKVRVMLGFLGVEYEIETVDFHPGREHESDEFRSVNPLGHIPVLDDDGFVVRDAHAILLYLGRAYGEPESWYPVSDLRRLGEMHQWMSFAESLMSTLGAARLAVNLDYDFDLVAAQRGGHRLLRVLDEHLWFNEHVGHEWLCRGNAPTVADVAVFADVVLCEEGGILRQDYPSVRRWLDRFKCLPDFVVMPGVFPFALS